MGICVVGDPEDLTSVYVAYRARELGVTVRTLDESSFGIDWTFSYRDPPPRNGRVLLRDRELRFDEIDGLYVRLSSSPELPEALDAADRERRSVFVRERRAAIQHFLDCFPGPVANRPRAGRSNASKPYQMRWLESAGLEVPRWIVSNDATAVQCFVDDHSTAPVYKSCSGLRSRVRLVCEELIERLEEGTVPVLVQDRIPGRDVRLHTVGEDVFATEISSPGVDYRFAGADCSYEETTVPDGVRERCVACATEDGLTIAGFDFRVTEEGTWYCLEMNPVPTFLPYEIAAGQPIADALLKRLIGSPVEQRREGQGA